MQICIVAIITVSLVSLDLQHEQPIHSPIISLAGCVVAQALLLLSALHVVRQTKRERSEPGSDAKQLGRRLDFRLTLHFAVWITGVLITLTCFQWPQFCLFLCNHVLIARLLVLTPAVMPLLLSWTILYSAERELHASVGKLRRWQFVLGQSRLLLFLPVSVILFVVVCQDLATGLARFDQNTWLGQTLRVVPLGVIAVLFPILLRMAWKTETLASGTLRDRLERHCDRLAFRKRDILVWNTDQRMRNAAISGLLPNWRYILLSDRLLADLPEQHVESVFLHEVGHAHHHHHLRLMVVMILMICTSVAAVTMGHPMLGVAGLVLGLVLISRFARLFELQADLWAANQSANFPFGYLRAIASIAPGDPDRRSWMHPSFQQRTDFLMLGAEAPKYLNYLMRRNMMATGIVSSALLLGLWFS